MAAPTPAAALLPRLLLAALTAAASGALVWRDEFDVDGAPNAAHWRYDLGDGCPGLCGWGNSEAQWYTDDAKNIKVEGGRLKIEARHDRQGQGTPFTSAKITSKGKVGVEFGAVEFSAKMPAACQGVWPAVWMLPVDESLGWPVLGEIDMLESKVGASGEVDHVSSALHFGENWPGNRFRSQESQVFAGQRLSTEFVTYRCEWTPKEIRFYADGQLYNTQRDTTWFGRKDGKDVNPFQSEMYLIINLAIGGAGTAFTGSKAPDAACIEEKTPSLEVEWIRVYDREGVPETSAVACGDYACDYGETGQACPKDCNEFNGPPANPPPPPTPAPATDAPATEAPSTDAPMTSAPVTVEPSTAPPAATPEPASAVPGTVAPTTLMPETEAPGTSTPGTATVIPVTATPVLPATTSAPQATGGPVGPTPSPAADTPTPATPAPATLAPAPATALPDTPAPVLETQVPTTGVPASAPPTADGGATRTPPTPTPAPAGSDGAGVEDGDSGSSGPNPVIWALFGGVGVVLCVLLLYVAQRQRLQARASFSGACDPAAGSDPALMDPQLHSVGDLSATGTQLLPAAEGGSQHVGGSSAAVGALGDDDKRMHPLLADEAGASGHMSSRGL